MNIRISTIPPRGLDIKETLPLDSLNARMNEGRENDIVFTAAPQVELTVLRTIEGAETKGSVRTKYKQQCSWCLDPVERELEIEAKFVLSPRPAEKSVNEAGSFEDDIGVVYYDNDHVDLEDVIQEALILSLSRFWHPPVDEKGACTVCGRNVEAERKQLQDAPLTLGALLKKAGVSANN